MREQPLNRSFRRATDTLGRFGPGLLVSVIVAVAAQFLAQQYGPPAMLMALLLGLALHFLGDEGRCVQGIGFTARHVLRFGVALLGARVSFELLVGLGPALIALIGLGVVATILVGLLGARLLGRGWRLALLTGGAVAICGASAAAAIAAVLPRNEYSERNFSFTVLGVTVLSTLAMIAYPIIVSALELDDRSAGVFLGGTIHDVAQVVGAGFTISDEVGETATLVKLIRVALLAPVVLILTISIRRFGPASSAEGRRPPLLPEFVIAFLALAALNSAGAIPERLSEALGELSRWALLAAIAAVGMRTALRSILEVGGQAIALIIAETVFIASFILAGLYLAI